MGALPTRPVRSGLTTMTLADLLAMDLPRREYLVSPVLRQGESMLLWAAPGVGKTMLSLTLALAMAGGGAVLGWTSPKPRRVLVVDGEMAREDLQDRLRMLAATVEGLDMEAAGENLRLLARTGQDRGATFPDLAQDVGQEAILDIVEEYDVEVVVLDNLSTLAEVEDENDAAAMGPVLTFLLRLKQARTACILVHHSGKAGTTYRGSSRLATTFEVILGLIPPEGTGEVRGTAFTLDWGKYRGAPHPSLTQRDVRLEGVGEVLRWVERPSDRDDVRKLLEAVAAGTCGSGKELAAHLGWDEPKVSRMKSRAIAEGRTTKTRFEEALGAVREGRRLEDRAAGMAPF